jgi:hypothetical protein
MLLYKFQPAPMKAWQVALASDVSGAKLPPDGAPWRRVGEVEISLDEQGMIAARPEEVIASIEDKGYFIWQGPTASNI